MEERPRTEPKKKCKTQAIFSIFIQIVLDFGWALISLSSTPIWSRCFKTFPKEINSDTTEMDNFMHKIIIRIISPHAFQIDHFRLLGTVFGKSAISNTDAYMNLKLLFLTKLKQFLRYGD